MDVVESTLIKKFLALNVLLTLSIYSDWNIPLATKSPQPNSSQRCFWVPLLQIPGRESNDHVAVKPACGDRISEGHLESKFALMDSLRLRIFYRAKLLVPVRSNTQA